MTDKKEERREYPRLDARVRVTTTFLPPGGEEAVRRDFRSMNVSSGGIRVECDAPLELGAFVSLHIELPEGDDPVDLFAKVVWCRPQGQESHLVGLRFLSGSQESLDALTGFLEPPKK